MLLMGVLCYGENYFEISKKPAVSFGTSFIAPIQQSLKNEAPSVSCKLLLDFSSLDFNSGFRVSSYSTDSVLNFFIRPVSLKKFELGLGAGYHLYDYFDSFIEQDISSENYIAFFYKNIFRCQIDFGISYKITSFKNKALSGNHQKNLLFGVNFLWNINDIFSLYFSLKSADYFDYCLFGTPFFKLGTNINCNEKVSFGLDYTVKMIDLVAVAENVSEMLLEVYTKVKF